MPPQAPAGDDNEKRPLQLKLDPPIIVFQALPPPPPAPAAVVAATTQKLAPAISGVKAKLHTTLYAAGGGRIGQRFTLYVTFRVNRSVSMGLQAFHKSKLVASTGLQHLEPKTGTLKLKLVRSKWPTKLSFVTDSPSVTLLDPGPSLHGTVTLRATASAIKGRKVASIRFDYASRGTDAWSEIGTAAASPYSVSWDTTSVPSGSYDLRAVVTDSAGVSAISKIVTKQGVSN
jgi:hypothetical protein